MVAQKTSFATQDTAAGQSTFMQLATTTERSSSLEVPKLTFLVDQRPTDGSSLSTSTAGSEISPEDSQERKLEKLLSSYGRHFEDSNLAQFSIIDSNDETLTHKLESHGFELTDLTLHIMPQLPASLRSHLFSYHDVTTVLGCKKLSYESEADWQPDQTWQVEQHDLLFCKRWIDRTAETVMSLVTGSHSLLQQNLAEGAWEGIYWTILDLAFTNHPSLMLQRRDTTSMHYTQTLFQSSNHQHASMELSGP